MADIAFTHSEAFLQYLWENMLFDFTELKTSSGKSITVFDPGALNSSDGPDFKRAHLDIDGIQWYGDVELHTHSSHWNAHGHQTDANYNSVILHVVTNSNPAQVYTENESTPFTLNIRSHLPSKIQQLLNSFEHPKSLPCTSNLEFISENAFYQQLEKAHTEYFEKKADDFLTYYDPEIKPSEAWKHALIISLWDGLGISYNRNAMQSVARRLLNNNRNNSAAVSFEKAYQIAGFRDSPSDITWNYKSVRPANHPKNRIREAVLITKLILDEPFGHFLKTDAHQLWERWLAASSLKNTGHLKILFGTVFLPALYLLGKLFSVHKLSEQVHEVWNQLKTPIPPVLLKKFGQFELEDKSYRKKLGAIHQLKAYCGPGKCSECFVLKKAIES